MYAIVRCVYVCTETELDNTIRRQYNHFALQHPMFGYTKIEAPLHEVRGHKEGVHYAGSMTVWLYATIVPES